MDKTLNSTVQSVKSESKPSDLVKTSEPNLYTMATLEPPAFMSEVKSYAQYKKDLRMWSRITQVDKKLQAELVVYKLEGHPSGIKEKITTALDEKLVDNENGIMDLIEYLDSIYLEDEMADAWEKYKLFEDFQYNDKSMSMAEFIAQWETKQKIAKTAGCEYSDSILAFKLLEKANLDDTDVKVVLTQVDYKTGKEKKNLLQQMQTGLKKFQSRHPIINKSKNKEEKGIKVDESLLANIEDALVAKGWQKPRPRKRSNTDPGEKPRFSKDNGYKGRKNRLGEDGKPLRCFKCNSEYHLAPKCTKPRNEAGELNFFTLSSDETEVERNQNQEYLVLVAESEICLMIAEAENKGLVDSGCSKTVTGKRWLEKYLADLPKSEQEKVQYGNSTRIYKFGGGEERPSLHTVVFPAAIGERKVFISSEVVDSNIPLLLGSNFLRNAHAVLDFGKGEAKLLDQTINLDKTKSGHFCLTILNEKMTSIKDGEKKDDVISAYITSVEILTEKELKKLHHYFGHTSTERLLKLIEKTGRADSATKDHLEKIKQDCTSCLRFSNSAPKPKVSLPRCANFNAVVTLDLKDRGKDKGSQRYILYMIDSFSRFTLGSIIPNKHPSYVVEAIMKNWIGAGFGIMDTIHSDRGGEFTAKDIEDVASNLNIKVTNTAALSPNQNGMCERNHAVVDSMIQKMMDKDPQLDIETALCWALNAKNTLENHQGFSPAQLVFGKNPTLPSVLQGTPATWENVTMSNVFAKHINTLHSAREQFIISESDRILKAALKDRVYPKGDNIMKGDYVFFKQTKDKAWKGPNKVVSDNGKTLYVDVCGRLNAVNRDDCVQATDVQLSQEAIEDKKEVPSSSEKSQLVEIPAKEPTEMVSNLKPRTENLVDNAEESVTQDNTEQVGPDSVNPGMLKPNMKLEFKLRGEGDPISGTLINRGGKATGKYRDWWNVATDSDGRKCFDFKNMEYIKITEEDDLDDEEHAFVVVLPRNLHGQKSCIEAKIKEIGNLERHDVFEEVPDKGQKTIGTNWIVTEKVVDGKTKVKARLCARGDQELDKDNIRTDSPTIDKTNIKLILLTASQKQWQVKTSDVSCAFLQGAEIDREVYVKPPAEKRIPNTIWKLKKSIYGLDDAARNWYISLHDSLKNLGCCVSRFDPALFTYHENGELKGLVGTHVDDILHTGNDSFEKNVIQKLKKIYSFGTEEEEIFRYVGMNVKRLNDGISVDQDHYIEALQVPDLKKVNMKDISETLDEQGQSSYRSAVGKIGWLCAHSRPDLSFDYIDLSSKFGKATVKDMKSVSKLTQKLKADTTAMLVPNLGSVSDWEIHGYGDVGLQTMPDGISSCGGQVVILQNKISNKACVISWRSRKLRRVVNSTLAGEALATTDLIGEIQYVKAVLADILGDSVHNIPVIIYTDSKNLFKAATSTALVDDRRLRTELAMIKEALSRGEIQPIIWIPGTKMLANCLTKRGASSEALLKVLRTGYS